MEQGIARAEVVLAVAGEAQILEHESCAAARASADCSRPGRSSSAAARPSRRAFASRSRRRPGDRSRPRSAAPRARGRVPGRAGCIICWKCSRISSVILHGRSNSPFAVDRSRRAAGSPRCGALLAWYRRHRRDMPWGGTRDPYGIWVSEVMLQQTQVATALPLLPEISRALSDAALPSRAAPNREVLAAWSGLGYYRRARHLHAAAREVVREHGGLRAGRAPSVPPAARRRPLHAGAVLSIGFGLRCRCWTATWRACLSRLFALDASVREPLGARALWELAESLVPRGSRATGINR